MEYWRTGQRLHIDRHCKNFSNKNEVYYIDTAKIKTWNIATLPLCPKCVADEAADVLKYLITNKPDTTSVYH